MKNLDEILQNNLLGLFEKRTGMSFIEVGNALVAFDKYSAERTAECEALIHAINEGQCIDETTPEADMVLKVVRFYQFAKIDIDRLTPSELEDVNLINITENTVIPMLLNILSQMVQSAIVADFNKVIVFGRINNVIGEAVMSPLALLSTPMVGVVLDQEIRDMFISKIVKLVEYAYSVKVNGLCVVPTFSFRDNTLTYPVAVAYGSEPAHEYLEYAQALNDTVLNFLVYLNKFCADVLEAM